MINKKWLYSIIIASIFILLSACGSTEEPVSENVKDEGDTKQTTKTITHPGGETTIEGVPEKVVILSEPVLDHALALGVTPVAASPYHDEFIPHLQDKVEGIEVVGTSPAPNLEAILEVSPDLILGLAKTHDKVYEQLEAIAPTILVDPSKTWQENLEYIGNILSKEDEAKAYIENYNEKANNVKSALEENVGDETVVFIRVRSKGLVVYGATRNVGSILYHDLGLTPSEIVPMDKWATNISEEVLPEIDPDHIFLLVDEGVESKLDDLKEQSIWKGLKAVQNDQIYSVNYSPWINGYAPIGNSEAIDIVAEYLAE